MVAIRKQPKVITSSKEDSWDRILISQAASKASGIGEASERSKGIRV